MAKRNEWCLAFAMLVLTSCQYVGDEAPVVRPEQRRQALEPLPPIVTGNPIASLAETQFTVPADDVLVISSDDFAILLDATRGAPLADSVTLGAQIAEVGNTASALGIVGTQFDSCPTGCQRTGKVFIVATDAQRYQVGSEWRLQATTYRVAVLGSVTGSFSWVARANAVLLRPSSVVVSDSRCCDRGQRCVAYDPHPTVGPGGCGPADRVYCGGWISEGLLAHGSSVNTGRAGAPIQANVYPASSSSYPRASVDLTCLPPKGGAVGSGLGPTECGIAHTRCDMETLPGSNNPEDRFWSTVLDSTNLICLPGNTRPISGRDFPEVCHTIRSPVDMLAECSGHCENCAPWMSQPDSFLMSDYVPPSCAVAQYDPENSSICLPSTHRGAWVTAFHGWMLSQIGGNNCTQASVSGRCCGNGCVCEGETPSGHRLCQQCDASGCKQFALPPAHDPLAAKKKADIVGDPVLIEGNAGTPTKTAAEPTERPAPTAKDSDIKAAEKASANVVPHGGSAKPDTGHAPTASGEKQAAKATASQEKKDKGGDPVGLLEGDLVVQQTDLSFPGAPGALTFTRSYSSRSSGRGTLGSNWSHNWEVHLEILREGTNPTWAPQYCAGGGGDDVRCVLLSGAGGGSKLFLYDERTQVFMPQAGSTDTLIRVVNHPFATDIPNVTVMGWALRTSHGDLLTFDKEGYLMSSRDRFGNGFSLTYEDTPFFALWQDCKAYAASHAGVVPRGCRLVDALVGEKALPQERLTPLDGSLALNNIGTHADAEAYYNANFATGGAVLGRSAFGAAKRRPVTVEDDLGRRLVFTYSVPGTTGYAPTAANAHLLTKVEGPVGTVLKLSYGRNPIEPADLNESFLVQVERADTSSSAPDVHATPQRVVSFAYDWAPVPDISLISGSIGVDGTVYQKYLAYFGTFVGCNGSMLDPCRNTFTDWIAPGNASEHARTATVNLAAATWDNLLTITHGGILEAATRYVRDPMSAKYDKVTEQRYGSRQSLPPMSGPALPLSSETWSAAESAVPLAKFTYVEAGPLTDPLEGGTLPGDRTGSELPSELQVRYRLEVANLAEAIFDGSPLDIGRSGPTGSPCRFDLTEARRKELPGHMPSYAYFPDPELQPGQFAPDFQLRRSHLTCEQIAESHLSDAFSNDNLSILVPLYTGVGSGTTLPDGGFRDISRHTTQRIVGRRVRVAQDANRICQWTRFVDRDGDVTWHGLNFQGLSLVEASAVRAAPQNYRIVERRYNADGSLVRETRPFLHNAAPKGLLELEYQEIAPDGQAGRNDRYPAWWAQRKNLIQRVDRVTVPISVESESQPGVMSSVAASYQKFQYEPIYNQVVSSKHGTLNAASPAVATEHGSRIFIIDYQELQGASSGPASVKPLLDSLRGWGFDWVTTGVGAYDYGAIAQTQLGIELFNDDFNNDTVKGFPAAQNISNHRGRGVPVYAVEKVPGTATRRNQVMQWSVSGQLAHYWDSLGAEERRYYYPLTTSTGAPELGGTTPPMGPAVTPFERGLLASVKRRSAPLGYAIFHASLPVACASLAGPYQYLLPSTCSSNPKADLVAAGYPADFADSVVAASKDNTGAFAEIAMSYNIAGHARYVWEDGQATHRVTDADGRLSAETAPDGVLTNIGYDVAVRPFFVSRSKGSEVVSEITLRYDDEGRMTSRCAARVAGACGAYPAAPRPVDTAVVELKFTYEGHALQRVDEASVVDDFTVDDRGLVVAQTTRPLTGTAFEPRRAAWSYDDDGLVTSEQRAQTAAGAAPLSSKSWTRNAFGAAFQVFDGTTHWALQRSARGLLTRIHETSSPAASLWSVRFGYDVWGGETSRSLNGELQRETHRNELGLRVGAGEPGQSAVFYTLSAGGDVLWASNEPLTAAVFDKPSRRHYSMTRASSSASPIVMTVSVDPMGRPLTWEERGGALSRTAFVARDAAGFVSESTGFDGYSTAFTRDLFGWPSAVDRQAGPQGQQRDTSSYVYNVRGLPTTVTDPKGETTAYVYSPLGELKSLTGFGPHAQHRQWEYDRLSRPLHSTRVTGQPFGSLDYTWVGASLESISSGGQPVVSVARDVLGRPVAASAYNLALPSGLPGEVLTEIGYDGQGRVQQEVHRVGGSTARVVNSTWSVTGIGVQRTLKLPVTASGTTEWLESFDVRGRLRQKDRIAHGPATGVTFNYLGSAYVGRTHDLGLGGSPMRHAITLDPLMQPSGTRWTAVDVTAQGQPVHVAEGTAYCLGQWIEECARPMFEEELVRYASGQLGSHLSTYGFPAAVGERHQWRGGEFGGRGEVVALFDEWIKGPGPDTGVLPPHSLRFDDVVGVGSGEGFAPWSYQREEFTGATATIEHPQRGARLKLQRAEGYRLDNVEVAGRGLTTLHDDDGALTRVGGRLLHWGPLGELAAVETSSRTEAYVYDAFGRLVGRTDDVRLLETYAWDGVQMVAAFEPEGNTLWEATWGPGLDQLIEFRKLRTSSSTEYLPVTDSRFSVVGLMEYTSRQTLQVVHYSPEGAVTIRDGNDAVVCDELDRGSPCELPEGLPFGFNSAWRSESTGLVYMRNRWYSAELGEFLSHDPLGPIDSFSLYAFAAFDPINRRDPFGLAAPPVFNPLPTNTCDANPGSCSGAPETGFQVGQPSVTSEAGKALMEGAGKVGPAMVIPAVVGSGLTSTQLFFWSAGLGSLATKVGLIDPLPDYLGSSPFIDPPSTTSPVIGDPPAGTPNVPLSLPGADPGRAPAADPAPPDDAARIAGGGTYTLNDPDTGDVMRTGRTKDLESRRKQHARDPALKHLEFEIDRRTGNYEEQRGREQIIHDLHQPPLNYLRPISPTNPKRDKYLNAGKKLASPDKTGSNKGFSP